MAAMFWNPRGVGEDIKKSFIRNAINDNKLHFVGLQETKKSKILSSDLSKMSDRHDFSWVVAPSVGQGGGMLLGVNNSFYDVIESEVGVF